MINMENVQKIQTFFFTTLLVLLLGALTHDLGPNCLQWLSADDMSPLGEKELKYVHCRLKRVPHTIYWKSPNSILEIAQL